MLAQAMETSHQGGQGGACMAKGEARTRRKDAMVIGASSLGTVFEWYDFYL